GVVWRGEIVERGAGVGGVGDLGEDIRRIRGLLRQLDVVADAGIGEAAGLHVAGISEHRVRELELGFGERVRAQTRKGRRLVVVNVEAVGVGALQARKDGLSAGVLHAFVEPQGGEVASLIERLDRRALSLVGENRVGLGREQVANLFRHRAVGGIERGQWIRRRRLLARDGGIGRRRGDRGVVGRRRSLARCSRRRTPRRRRPPRARAAAAPRPPPAGGARGWGGGWSAGGRPARAPPPPLLQLAWGGPRPRRAPPPLAPWRRRQWAPQGSTREPCSPKCAL